LAEVFYSPETRGGDIVADEVIDGFDAEQHIVGTIHDVEFIDDRWRDGLPNRVVTVLPPPPAPDHPDPGKIRKSMVDVLDGPSMFQSEAASIQKLLRRYLELVAEMDLEAGLEPRVQMFCHHRVLTGEDGFYETPDGRLGVRIEALQEFDYKGKFVRTRMPGSEVIDLGVPQLFMIAQGFSSSDAQRLGFQQHDVEVDHEDGRGPVVAQADFLAGLVEVLVGGRLRRRISSEFDEDGQEYWIRQIAVGHENDPEVGWVLCQVPDFKTFDPVESGLVPAGTDPDTPEFFAAVQALLYDYYTKQAADILDIPRNELKQVQMIYGPKLFSLIERIGDDALVAANGVVAGDSFGNGHFLTSGGAMTGMIGHGFRVLEYWQARDAGVSSTEAIHQLAHSIKEDTHAWLQVSATEYSQALPINFGGERIEQINQASGGDRGAQAQTIEAARRQRHNLVPLNPSDWRRLFIHNGKVISELPDLGASHPLMRPERELSLAAVMNLVPPAPDPELADAELERSRQPPDRRATTFMPAISHVGAGQELPAEVRTRPKARFSIGRLTARRARSYPFLCVLKDGQVVQRFELERDQMLVGRGDDGEGAAPDLDLAPFDGDQTVSREHARIRREDGRFVIEDLESTNRTRLGDSPLSPGDARQLEDGQLISFGGVTAAFRLFGTSELPAGFSQS
ncbi:MAG: FHA domain-containing protein, partial [Solirubrobacterales bacterium]|nr:FHA domain-containing protein [Solirubrobacterales bacterium]